MDFPDQSHINRVRDALWHPHAGRASVMIGSGFSLNCELKMPGISPPTDWKGLAEAMRLKLYPTKQSTKEKRALATDDALLLAEQYRISFGREELHRFLRQQIRDEQIEPGEFHRRLLSLPWKDVFTTNWDTLLERTSENILPRTYGIVREVEEIPLASQPRIVKLHGSLPANFPLIVTQEDYRKYPVCFAPFVNTAQQAMMESVFLLIGFSGKDPNFLHWSGWVRDKLGSSAPVIYAAGWLDLSIHERRVLESRNVIPIDLALHPQGSSWDRQSRHRIATDWILRSLEFGKPYPSEEWPKVFQRKLSPVPDYMKPLDETSWQSPSIEESYVPHSENLDLKEACYKQLASWARNRTLYPGWLTVPVNRLAIFTMVTKRWEPVILEFIGRVESVTRANMIRELVWRHEIGLNTISPEIARVAATELEHAREQELTTDASLEELTAIALSLVEFARFRLDEGEFKDAIARVEHLSNQDPEVLNRLHHEKSLWALWDLDFDRLESELEAWNPDVGEPFWLARKAALLMEIGRDKEADSLLRMVINALRPGHSTSPTIPVLSRQAWAHYLLNKLQIAPWDDADESYHSIMRDLRRFNCDPEDDLKKISRELMQFEETKPSSVFDLEHRRVERTTIKLPEHYISGPEALRRDSARRAIRFGEVNALPPFVGHWWVTEHILSNAAKVLHDDGEIALALRLMLRITNSDESDLIKMLLSRPKVAAMSRDLTESMVDLCLRVIDYFLQRSAQVVKSTLIYPHDRIRVAMETVSRLVLRLSPEKVCGVFTKALEYYRTSGVFDNFFVYDAIGNLLKRAWEALPAANRTDFVFDVLQSPIVGVDGFDAEPFRFNDPGHLVDQYETTLPARSDDTESEWRATIRFLLHSLEFDQEARSRAMFRLVKIVMGGLLSESETRLVAQAIWGDPMRHQRGLPGEENLRHWVFLCMPESEPGAAMRWFREKWLSVEDDSVINDVPSLESALFHLGDVIERSRDHEINFEFTPSEKAYILKLIQRWAGIPVPSDFSLGLPILDHERADSIRRAIHGMTSLSLHFDISSDIAADLYIKQRNLFNAALFSMPLLISLSKTLGEKKSEIAKVFREGLSSENEDLVYHTTHTLELWLHFAGTRAIEGPPEDLIRELGFTIAARRRPALRAALNTIRWIFEKGDPAVREKLRENTLEGLSFLVHELDYSNTEYENTDEVPNMRWNCVAIARAIHEDGYDDPIILNWLQIAEEDPLPEVRHLVTDVTQ